MSAPSMSDYGTHVPILVSAVVRAHGPVAELGAGVYSTAILHYLCKTIDQPLVTVDTSKDWLDKWRYLESPSHEFMQVDEKWEGMDWLKSRTWGVVFIDCAPGETRKDLIKLCKDNNLARFVIAHDSEEMDRHIYPTGGNYQMEGEFNRFTYRTDYKGMRPYTTIVSDYEKFEIEEGDTAWQPPESQKA